MFGYSPGILNAAGRFGSDQVWRVIVRDDHPSCGNVIDLENVLLSSPAVLRSRVFFVPYFNGLNCRSLEEEDRARID